MKAENGQILYVGKARVLRNRVHSYFAPPARLGPKTSQLVSQIHSIDHIEVQSELEALLLESRLIKKFKPPYNIAAKDDKSPYFIHITREDFPRPIINHVSSQALAGPFLNRYIPSQILKHFRQIAPFCVAPRPVKRPCLYSHLGLCSPCPASGDKAGYHQNILRLKKLLTGHFQPVRKSLNQQMHVFSQAENFEQAGVLRDKLANLDRLLAVPISPDDYIANPNLTQDLRLAAIQSLQSFLPGTLHRIEFYDNAHLQGTSAASAMTVAIDGEVTPRNYRHFTLHTTSDVDMMREVLTRRLKRTDWPAPDLIVLDGGAPQLSVTKDLGSNLTFISLAKKREELYLSDGQILSLPHSHPGLQLLMHLRDEAHRFSRRLHHKHRSSQVHFSSEHKNT